MELPGQEQRGTARIKPAAMTYLEMEDAQSYSPRLRRLFLHTPLHLLQLPRHLLPRVQLLLLRLVTVVCGTTMVKFVPMMILHEESMCRLPNVVSGLVDLNKASVPGATFVMEEIVKHRSRRRRPRRHPRNHQRNHRRIIRRCRRLQGLRLHRLIFREYLSDF